MRSHPLGRAKGGRGAVDEEAMAVLSHGLLNRVAVLLETATRLTATLDWAEDAERIALLENICEHARWIADVLETVARGLPHDVLIALDRQTPTALHAGMPRRV